MLLVHDDKAELFKLDAVLDERVSPDHKMALPCAMWRRMSRLRSCSIEPVSSTIR